MEAAQMNNCRKRSYCAVHAIDNGAQIAIGNDLMTSKHHEGYYKRFDDLICNLFCQGNIPTITTI